MIAFQLFFPAWTILYIAMGFASFIVWKKGDGFQGRAKVPLIIFIIQLILNWFWTPIFFGLHALLWAFVEIVVLFVFIVITTALFYKIDFIAGSCLLPYIAWVSFAATLNYSLWDLNRNWFIKTMKICWNKNVHFFEKWDKFLIEIFLSKFETV